MLNDDDRRLNNQAITTLTHLLFIHKISPYNKNREAGGNMCLVCKRCKLKYDNTNSFFYSYTKQEHTIRTRSEAGGHMCPGL